jgi:hypothetical protein
MPNSHRFARMATAVASLALTLGTLAGCSGNNVACDLDSCTVTFNRGVDVPEAQVLGVPVKLISVQGSAVTIDVAGNRIEVPAGGGAEGVTVKEVTDDKVVVEIPNNLVN